MKSIALTSLAMVLAACSDSLSPGLTELPFEQLPQPNQTRTACRRERFDETDESRYPRIDLAMQFITTYAGAARLG